VQRKNSLAHAKAPRNGRKREALVKVSINQPHPTTARRKQATLALLRTKFRVRAAEGRDVADLLPEIYWLGCELEAAGKAAQL
jgi:hypothetical protein